jgi:diguanylate cyclase (GGDEF)-like protein/putative nucleotidyltransferase with HDIG domain
VASINPPSGAQPADTGSGFGVAAALQFGSRPARILIVTDEHSVRALQRRLESLGARVRAQSTGREVIAATREQAPDLILLDLAVPGLVGSRTIRALKKEPATHAIPIIVVSASNDVESRVENLEEGASDCLTRPISHAEVVARIRVILQAKAREDLLRRRVSFLEDLSASDPLTSLFNRRAFDDRLHLEMERAARTGQPLSCLILDIDWFKAVNDQYGHQVGDDVLRQIAKIMVDGRREHDAMCRYGGEEFVWLLPATDQATLIDRAEWLRGTIEDTEIPTAEGSFKISVSIGASTYRLSEHGRLSAHLLLEQADTALLEAKKLGKNRVVFREPAPEEVREAHLAEVDAAGGLPTAPRAATALPDGDGERHARPGADSPDTWGRHARLQEEIRVLLNSSVKVLTAALAAKDSDTMSHCHRVACTAVAVAMEMGLPAQEIERIKLASLIHDIGKLAIPEFILSKPAPLTAAEWEIVKKHPERGAAILQEARSFSHLTDLVLYHQESFDGTGYPDGLAGREIPLGARIIRVADTFDALTSDRPYRSRKSLEEAKAELQRMAGAALDPAVVNTLLRLLATMTPLEMQLTMRRDDGLLGEPAPPEVALHGTD